MVVAQLLMNPCDVITRFQAFFIRRAIAPPYARVLLRRRHHRPRRLRQVHHGRHRNPGGARARCQVRHHPLRRLHRRTLRGLYPSPGHLHTRRRRRRPTPAPGVGLRSRGRFDFLRVISVGSARVVGVLDIYYH